MAKKFSGFTDDQALILLNKVGFPGQSMQADEVSAFLAANPNAQAKLGQYAQAAQKRLDMLTTPTTGYAVGGLQTEGGPVQQLGYVVDGEKVTTPPDTIPLNGTLEAPTVLPVGYEGPTPEQLAAAQANPDSKLYQAPNRLQLTATSCMQTLSLHLTYKLLDRL